MLSVYLQSIGALLSPLMMLHTARAKRQDGACSVCYGCREEEKKRTRKFLSTSYTPLCLVT